MTKYLELNRDFFVREPCGQSRAGYPIVVYGDSLPDNVCGLGRPERFSRALAAGHNTASSRVSVGGDLVSRALRSRYGSRDIRHYRNRGMIAPNTWIEIKGANLAPPGDSRIWQGSDFANNQMPTKLDGVSAAVNGKSAYVNYISPTQINILTPSDAMSGPVHVVVANNGAATASLTVQAQALSPSFFIFGGGPYVAAVHANGTKPGTAILLHPNGFGPPNVPVTGRPVTQFCTLSPQPVIKIGNIRRLCSSRASSLRANFSSTPSFRPITPAADQPLTATYNGLANTKRRATGYSTLMRKSR